MARVANNMSEMARLTRNILLEVQRLRELKMATTTRMLPTMLAKTVRE